MEGIKRTYNPYQTDIAQMEMFFNKKKEQGVKRIMIGGKTLFEGTV